MTTAPHAAELGQMARRLRDLAAAHAEPEQP
jgi:hypothetical protein